MLLALPVQPGYVHAQAPAKNARKVLVRVEPEYPDFFRSGHFEARVVAEATVLPNGNVSSVDIKGGSPMFAEFVTKALMKWKYAPGPEQTVEQVSLPLQHHSAVSSRAFIATGPAIVDFCVPPASMH